jgi:hypothetical protein
MVENCDKFKMNPGISSCDDKELAKMASQVLLCQCGRVKKELGEGDFYFT